VDFLIRLREDRVDCRRAEVHGDRVVVEHEGQLVGSVRTNVGECVGVNGDGVR
jgi:hypothetical protein